jgi:hypothetical protein
MVKSECSHLVQDTEPFALDPATTPGSGAFLFKNRLLPAAIQVDEEHNRLLARRIGVGVQVYDYKGAQATWGCPYVQARGPPPVGRDERLVPQVFGRPV